MDAKDRRIAELDNALGNSKPSLRDSKRTPPMPPSLLCPILSSRRTPKTKTGGVRQKTAEKRTQIKPPPPSSLPNRSTRPSSSNSKPVRSAAENSHRLMNRRRNIGKSNLSPSRSSLLNINKPNTGARRVNAITLPNYQQKSNVLVSSAKTSFLTQRT